MIIEYYSNNSGGGDWLSAEDWKKLEDAGWKLFDFDSFIFENGHRKLADDGLPARTGGTPDRPKYAFKRFETLDVAIGEWENLTGQSAYETGCETCGDPHSFYSLED